MKDDRVVRLEGARDHPFTRGSLCAKVNDYPTRTYAPDRLLSPLRRVGETFAILGRGLRHKLRPGRSAPAH